MATRGVVLCEYLVDKKLCQAISKNFEGTITRDEFCISEPKNSCCYLCSHQESCEIGCNYLVKPEDTQARPRIEEDIDREIMKSEERSERLSALFAEGRIGEQSYLKSANVLETKIDALKKAKERSFVSPDYFRRLGDLERSSTEQPRRVGYEAIRMEGRREKSKSYIVNLAVLGSILFVGLLLLTFSLAIISIFIPSVWPWVRVLSDIVGYGALIIIISLSFFGVAHSLKKGAMKTAFGFGILGLVFIAFFLIVLLVRARILR